MSNEKNVGDWVREHLDDVQRWSAVDGPGKPQCLVTACDRDAFAAWLCKSHYFRAKRNIAAEVRAQGSRS